LLIVSAGTVPGRPPWIAACRPADSPLQHVSHEHFFDGARLDSRAAHGFADDESAEARRGQR